MNVSNTSAVLHQLRELNIAPTSFLSLPLELRTQIYEYLIPDDVVQGYWFSRQGARDSRPIRQDQQACCPAILRSNRQIHDEVIGMFYGTARFIMQINGRWRHFLGMGFSTQDSDNAPQRLPPGFRFVRSLRINLYIRWPWKSGEEPITDNRAIRLPLPGATLMDEYLSTGTYELRRVMLAGIVPFKSRMRAIIDTTIADQGLLFRAVLKQHLAPLRKLRGVDLQFDTSDKIGRKGVNRKDIIIESLRSREEVLLVFARLETIRLRFLRKLVEEVSQHTQVSS